MTGPKGNSEFCFPETLNVPRGEAEGNIEVEGKQNSLFPEGQVIKCFVIPPNSKIEKKNGEKMIYTSGSAELSCRNDVATITVYFFAANKSLSVYTILKLLCLPLMLNSRILGLI